MQKYYFHAIDGFLEFGIMKGAGSKCNRDLAESLSLQSEVRQGRIEGARRLGTNRAWRARLGPLSVYRCYELVAMDSTGYDSRRS
jgi:hypothetical protein